MSGYSQEVKFCVKYLLDHGVDSLAFPKVIGELSSEDKKFDLVPVDDKNKKAFFEELATKLRELWPVGEKDGKWPWRDSVGNLSKRIELLWHQRGFNDKTIDECLVAARKYLAQYENDVRYMQTLKYFIMKQKSLVEDNGRIRYVNESKFADILEGLSDQEKMDNELKQALEEPTYYEGEII